MSSLSLRWHFKHEREGIISKVEQGFWEGFSTSPVPGAGDGEPSLATREREIAALTEQFQALSEGVFQSWNRSPIGWIFGGGTALALVDLWVRWWAVGL